MGQPLMMGSPTSVLSMLGNDWAEIEIYLSQISKTDLPEAEKFFSLTNDKSTQQRAAPLLAAAKTRLHACEKKQEDRQEEQEDDIVAVGSATLTSATPTITGALNASGHVQELPQRYSLVSLAGVGMTVGNVWPAIGGTILVAISNGGPPGVLYEFLVVSFFYLLVAVSLAELASAVPSAGGVYHWATVLPGKTWGRPIGFFAGWWNYLGQAMGAASMTAILGNTIVQMYALNHPGFVAETWHVFVVYIICVWLSAALVCLANAAMPHLNKAGIFLIVAGFLITVVTVTAMPGHNGRPPLATSDFVWTEWTQSLGYSDGFVFVAGMLNGAYSIGSVDVITHLAEEIPHPERAVPIGMALQWGVGFLTGFCFLVAIMYAISDLSAVSAAAYPIAEIYRQGTGGAAGASALLSLLLVNIALCVVGLFITNGRTLWALARDGATPAQRFLGKIHEGLDMPLNATLSSAVLVTVMGCIYVGSTTAFNAFVASTILFLSSSYIVCIVPHLARRWRGRENVIYGPFKLRGCNGWVGVGVNFIAVAYLMIWFVIYSFPYFLPTNAASMNYSCLIWGGFTILAGVWWAASARKGYEGPKMPHTVVFEAEKASVMGDLEVNIMGVKSGA